MGVAAAHHLHPVAHLASLVAASQAVALEAGKYINPLVVMAGGFVFSVCNLTNSKKICSFKTI